MVNAPTIKLSQALAILSRWQSAAPPSSAAKLAQVAALLQSLSEENAYLNARLLEDDTLPVRPPAPASPSPLAKADDRTVTAVLREQGLSDPTVELLNGLNEALRPPLIAVRGRAELVQTGFLGQITPEQDVWLGAVQENVGRAFAVLDAVQEMVALQRGQVKIEPVNFISADLLAEAWERTRDLAHSYNHEITMQAPEVVPLARGDFYQSLMILTGLLDNAVRYTPPGGQIRLSVDNLGTHVLFSVVDNGIGLTDDDQAHIGKPFWRGDHHRLVRQHNGVGLRLYLARQTLALQDGELIFYGQPELGSTFSFTLPTPD